MLHALNSTLHRTVSTASKIRSCLKPSLLNYSDGKRPNGVIVVAWKWGKLFASMPCALIHYHLHTLLKLHHKVAQEQEGKGPNYLHLVTKSHLHSIEANSIFILG